MAKPTHYGLRHVRAACNAYIGYKARVTDNKSEVTCPQCRRVLGLPPLKEPP